MAETKAPSSSLLAKLSSFLFLIFLHLGCFVFSEKRRRVEEEEDQTTVFTKKRKRAIAPVLSFLKGIFSKSKSTTQRSSHPPTPPRSSSQAANSISSDQSPGGRSKRPSMTESEIINDGEEDLFFPLRNDIFPCTACGEIFQKPQALESHQATRHAVSELADGDSGKNIVQIIFNSSWRSSQGANNNVKTPAIHRILKIHNSTKILSRFEEHREAVKSRGNGGRRRDERCAADGNEVLRFHCATFVCELGTGVCGHQYCGVCGIIRWGFSAKLDGVSVMSTSRGAHAAVPDDVEEEFAFMNVKRAMLVCRVVAGRVGREEEEADKSSGGFDSVIAGGGGDELLVFTPKALLPCFVIVYTV